jgi:hypothetical protein
MAAPVMDPAAIAAEIAHVRSHAPDALRRRWRAEFGRKPPAGLSSDLLGRMIAMRIGEPGTHEPDQHSGLEAVRSQRPFGASTRATGEYVERPALLAAEAAAWCGHRHCAPVSVSRGGCSCQFGRASAPMMPQRVHTIRGPNVGTGTSSDHGSALRITQW